MVITISITYELQCNIIVFHDLNRRDIVNFKNKD